MAFDSFDAEAQRPRCCGAGAAPDAIVSLDADPAKTLVLACIGRLVAAGHARWRRLDGNDICVAFNTGETFLLAKTGIIRLA